MRILHIEDDVQLQSAIGRGFRRAYPGCELITVANPTAAITALQLGAFDIVVSDYNIDEGTGGEVWDWVRANMPAQRFMFLSDDDRIVSSGAPYVRKPAPMSEICTAIAGTIK